MSLKLTSHLCYAVFLRSLSICVLKMIHIIGGTRWVSQSLSLVNMWLGMRIAHRQLGARIVIGQDGQLSLPSACTLSWVLARHNSVCICMLPWVMDRLSSLDWVFVRLFLFGHGLAGFSVLGHGLVRVSLSGHGRGRDHHSQGLDWGTTISP